MSGLTTLWAIAQIVLGISFLIFVHELGHFVVARWCGVRCTVFSIGFGPKIISYQGKETDYRICWIPLGGYVAMAGEDPAEGLTGADWELSSKSVGQRAAVFSAGVAMNLVFAVVLFAVAFGLGVKFIEPQVGAAPAGSPAWNAGLLPGDRILTIDGKQILNFDQIALAVAFADSQAGMEIELERDGKKISRRVYPEYRDDDGVQWIGIWPPSRTVIRVAPDSPAWKAGLRTGDRIASLEGEKDIDSNRKLLDALSSVTGKSFEVVYERDGKRQKTTVESQGEQRYVLGVIQAGTIVKEVRKYDPADGTSPSVARRKGVEPDDRLFRLGGKPLYSLRLARKAVREWPAGWGKTVELVLLRGGDKEAREVSIKLNQSEAVALLDDLAPRSSDPLVGEVQPGLPAEKAGLVPGARILEMDGKKIATWVEMARSIQAAKGKKLAVVWEDPAGKRRETTIVPVQVTRVAGEIGFEFGFKLSDEVRYGVGKACMVGLSHSWEMTIKVVAMVRALLTRKVSARNLGGPILIAKASYAYIDRFGFGRFLYFLGLLSVNLVVLNLLPIPVLDGGHLLFLAIEAVKGKPVSEMTLMVSRYVGFFLILALIIFVMTNDIIRVWG